MRLETLIKLVVAIFPEIKRQNASFRNENKDRYLIIDDVNILDRPYLDANKKDKLG